MACSVCRRPDLRDKADRLLLEGATLRATARQTGLSKDSLARHLKAGHLASKIERAAEATAAADLLSGSALLARLGELQQAAAEILDRARESKDDHVALKAVRAAANLLALQGAAIASARGAASPADDRVEAALEELRRRRAARRALTTEALPEAPAPPGDAKEPER